MLGNDQYKIENVRYEPNTEFVLANNDELTICEMRGYGYYSTRYKDETTAQIIDKVGNQIATLLNMFGLEDPSAVLLGCKDDPEKLMDLITRATRK